ncbi:hypothetical protein [Flavobacterium phage FL-1]|nr:hypothetical protein [Flavobacterium phage FL-1]
MNPTLSHAVKDMTGQRNVTEEYAKQYVSDHWIPFLIYQRHLFKMAELRKKTRQKPRKLPLKK